MKPRIAAICAIVAFGICGDRAPAQFPGCGYIMVFNPCPVSSETRGDCKPIIDPQEACQGCQPGEGACWVVNDRRDGGEAKLTIRVTLWDVVLGSSTVTDQVLTLAPGERRKLGCSFSGRTGYTWDIEDCQPRPPQVFADKQLTPTEKKFADAQDAFLDHVGQLWNANRESNYRQLTPGTVKVELSTSSEGQLVETRVLSNSSNQMAAQLIIDVIRPAVRFLATGKASKITAEVTAFAAEGCYFGPHDKRPVVNVRVSQGGLHYPYETGACFSFTDLSERHSIWDRDN